MLSCQIAFLSVSISNSYMFLRVFSKIATRVTHCVTRVTLRRHGKEGISMVTRDRV